MAFKATMALKMRPTGLGHGVYKDVPDYNIYCGEWCIGRIYENRASREHALVLGAARSRRTGDPALFKSGRDARDREGRVRGGLETVEGVGGVGGGGMKGVNGGCNETTVSQDHAHRPAPCARASRRTSEWLY